MIGYVFTAFAILVSLAGLIYQRASYNRDKIKDAEKMGALMQRVETMKEDISKNTAIEAKISALSENVVKLTENVRALTDQMAEIKTDIRDIKNGK